MTAFKLAIDITNDSFQMPETIQRSENSNEAPRNSSFHGKEGKIYTQKEEMLTNV